MAFMAVVPLLGEGIIMAHAVRPRNGPTPRLRFAAPAVFPLHDRPSRARTTPTPTRERTTTMNTTTLTTSATDIWAELPAYAEDWEQQLPVQCGPWPDPWATI